MTRTTRFLHPRSALILAALLPLTAPAQTAYDSGNGEMCTGDLGIPKRPAVNETLAPGDTLFRADRATMIENGISHLEGNVEVTQDQKQVRADSIDYNQPTNSADLHGDVNYWDDQVYLHSPEAQVNFDANTAHFTDAHYNLLSNRGHGSAKDLSMVIHKTTKGKQVDYTTCDPETGKDDSWNLDQNFWKISASSITLNHETERGRALNVILRIKDIPVFYTPYLSFPISKKRKSGFLVPSFGTSSSGGFQFSTPYYWNIEPQMDATLTPTYITDRGVMASGEYRYLFKQGHGQINLDYLPSDNQYGGHHRSSIHFEHQQTFLKRGSILLLFNQVSDDRYFQDFGNNLATSSTRYLPREADIRYASSRWRVRAHVQDYQIVDPTLITTARPYSRLPQIDFSAYPLRGKNRLNLRLDSQFSYFARDNKIGFVDDVDGFRLDLYPKISYPLQTRATFLTPTVGLRYTRYDLSNSTHFSDSPSRLLPMASLDGGVFLERNFSLFGKKYKQTLEPRFYYLYVPDKNQTDLPVFDTGVYGLTFYTMFLDNRFNGPDRFGDANQITLSLNSRLIESGTGREQAYFRIGQIFYLDHQDVRRQILNSQGDLVYATAPNDAIFSPVVMEAGTNYFRNWHFDAQLQWDPTERKIHKIALNAQYQPAKDKVLNLAYRETRSRTGDILHTTTNIEQTDVSFQWPINRRWSVVGRWNYAVREGKSLDLFAGFAYQGCCWGIRAVARRYLANLNGSFQTGFFIQLQLKGLAGLGQKTVDLLTQSIPGYQREF